MWIQREIVLDAKPRGFHLITQAIIEALPELEKVQVGLLHLFLQHTSASLTINENADPDVRFDLENSMGMIVSEMGDYAHSLEGPDDMPAHVKSTLIGSELTIPVGEGRLRLGTWQGIQLAEHRNRGGNRRLIATLNGQFG